MGLQVEIWEFLLGNVEGLQLEGARNITVRS